MSNVCRRQHTFYRRLQLHQQGFGTRDTVALRLDAFNRQRRVRTRMNTDNILPFSVDKNQRHPGGFVLHYAYRRDIDIVALQLLAHALTGVVIARTGNKGDVCPAAPGGDRLVSALAAKGDLVAIARHRFARRRERFKVENVIGINTAKDDELTCSFHIWRVHQRVPPGSHPVAYATLFFICCPSGSHWLPESHITA
ncbi:hypothetical protein D3C75_276540 [compost metagenome]